MGLGGISLWQLLIVLVIVLLIFGTKRLRSLGGDLGSAVKGFRRAMDDAEDEDDKDPERIEEPDAEFSESQTDDQKTDRHQAS